MPLEFPPPLTLDGRPPRAAGSPAPPGVRPRRRFFQCLHQHDHGSAAADRGLCPYDDAAVQRLAPSSASPNGHRRLSSRRHRGVCGARQPPRLHPRLPPILNGRRLARELRLHADGGSTFPPGARTVDWTVLVGLKDGLTGDGDDELSVWRVTLPNWPLRGLAGRRTLPAPQPRFGGGGGSGGLSQTTAGQPQRAGCRGQKAAPIWVAPPVSASPSIFSRAPHASAPPGSSALPRPPGCGR